jgi:hypothetical protein
MNRPDEGSELLKLSARLGRDPLLVQASSGNTSIKLGGTLWGQGFRQEAGARRGRGHPCSAEVRCGRGEENYCAALSGRLGDGEKQTQAHPKIGIEAPGP